MSCSIPANPDISGIGVRIAIYIQNFLSFIPAFWALMDREVTSKELKTIEKQSTTILITAFAVLISAIVQITTLGLSSFHTVVVLNLSWMNNTNTFIYFLLYIHHKSSLTQGEERVESRWCAWYAHVARAIWPSVTTCALNSVGESKHPHPPLDYLSPSCGQVGRLSVWASIVRKRLVLVLGSLHLTLMAVLGLWLWASPSQFERHQSKLISASGGISPVWCTSTTLVGKDVALTSRALRTVSLIIYSCFVVPGLNLLIPAILFLFAYISLRNDTMGSSWVFFRRSSKMTAPDKRDEHGTRSVCLGLMFLFAVNVILVSNIEITLHRAQKNDLQAQGESDWTFGQTLALLLLVLPMRDMIEYISEMWEAERARRSDKQLVDAVQREDVRAALRAARYASNVSVGISAGNFPSALQFAAYMGVPELVKILLDRGAYLDVQGGEHGTPLVAATSRGHERIIHLLLSSGANIHRMDSRGMQALHHASKRGLDIVVNALLGRGANVNATTNDGASALHLATQHGHDGVVGILVTHCADVLLNDGSSNMALHYAVQFCNSSSVRRLCGNHEIALPAGSDQQHFKWAMKWQIEHHKYLNTADCDGWTPICRAAALGHDEIVRVFLSCKHVFKTATGYYSAWDSQYRHLPELPQSLRRPWTTVCYKSVNARGAKGRTPLSHAAESGHSSVVHLLLRRHDCPDIVDEADEDGQTPLHHAAKSGRDSIIQILMQHGANCQAVDKYNRTPLMHAIMQNHESILLTMLRHSSQSVTHMAENGRTPLSYAAARGWNKMISILLEHGVDVNQNNNEGRSPLSYAIGGGHETAVRLLLDHGADINQADLRGCSPLIKAARVGHGGVVRLLLERGARVNQVSKEGYTALHAAIAARNDSIPSILLQHSSASISVRDNNGNTPLHLLCDHGLNMGRSLNRWQGRLAKNSADNDLPEFTAAPESDSGEMVAQILLDFGADIDQVNHDGDTPLHRAIIMNHMPLIQFLVKRGADTSRIVPMIGRTVLDLAVIHGKTPAVLFFLELGADVNPGQRSEGHDGGSPLTYAAEGVDGVVAHILLEHGARVDHMDGDGMTALMWALEMDLAPLVWDLLEHGASPNMRHGRDGQTPLIKAVIKGQDTTITTLLDHGADINLADTTGYTPLWYAVGQDYPDIVELLLKHGAAHDQAREGLLPLHLAIFRGNEMIAHLLRAAGAHLSEEEVEICKGWRQSAIETNELTW